MIVENRASALVAETVARAPADGYTLMVQGGTVWLTPLLQKVNYDMSHFAPLSLISRDIFILAAHPSVPAKSVRELVDLAKARPGVLNYSVGTPGGSGSPRAITRSKASKARDPHRANHPGPSIGADSGVPDHFAQAGHLGFHGGCCLLR